MTTTRTQPSGNSPALIAYYVPNRRNAPWLRIGAAWPHQDGDGFSLKVEMLALDVLKSGELSIQLRKPDPKDDQEDAFDPGPAYD